MIIGIFFILLLSIDLDDIFVYSYRKSFVLGLNDFNLLCVFLFKGLGFLCFCFFVLNFEFVFFVFKMRIV